MKIFLVNPSDVAFGTAVITPRWLFVLAAATPGHYGDPVIVDETLTAIDPDSIQPGDVVGIGVHTANVLRGMEVGRLAREKELWLTLYRASAVNQKVFQCIPVRRQVSAESGKSGERTSVAPGYATTAL